MPVDSIDSPAQGDLAGARERKKNLWKKVQELRQQIKDEPIGGNRGNLRLQLIKMQGLHSDAQDAERGALKAIEKRANELGLTTQKPRDQ